jgi:hypothetical protein
MTTPSPGAATDAMGQAVLDPTRNVLGIVEAAVTRLNDLAAAEREHSRQMADARHLHTMQIIERDREHAKELRELETARLDAVRGVDVAAVQTAAVAAENRAAALGAQVAAAAEAVRSAGEVTRNATTELISSTVKPLADAIAVIQQWMNQQTGQRAQVVETRESHGERRLNLGSVFGGLALLVSVIGTIILISRG